MLEVDDPRLPISLVHDKNVLAHFPGLEEDLEKFYEFIKKLRKGQGSAIVTPFSPEEVVNECAAELVSLAQDVGQSLIVAENFREEIARDAMQPAWFMGPFQPESRQQVGVIRHGVNQYEVLERNSLALFPSVYNFLAMRQRVSRSTAPEVHLQGGIEVYLPLVDGIDFFVGDQKFSPGALEGVVSVLPGDFHHLEKRDRGPIRTLILGGFGFTRGRKVDQALIKCLDNKEVVLPKFESVARYTNITLD